LQKIKELIQKFPEVEEKVFKLTSDYKNLKIDELRTSLR